MVSALALDFLPRNIRVNGINPGWFVTNLGNGPVNLAGVDSLGRSLSGGSFDKPPEKIPEIAPPSGKGARPQDMGMLALFLVCNDYFTGRVVTMDGGLMREFSPFFFRRGLCRRCWNLPSTSSAQCMKSEFVKHVYETVYFFLKNFLPASGC